MPTISIDSSGELIEAVSQLCFVDRVGIDWIVSRRASSFFVVVSALCSEGSVNDEGGGGS